jgi:predicted ATPase with chaperone activity
VDHLQQFAQWVSAGIQPPRPQPAVGRSLGTGDAYLGDLGDLPAVLSRARWALEVAAAGGHHLGLLGPPGCGKTMLAQRLPSLLPDLDNDAAHHNQALETFTPDLLAPLSSITVPVTILHGDQDPVLPLGHGEAVAAAIPGARLHVIPGMGHAYFSPGLPEELADLIRL